MSAEKHSENKFARIDIDKLNAWWRLWLYWSSAAFCWCWLRIFNNLQITGQEKIPVDLRSYIVVSNHTSNHDPFILGATLYRRKKPIAFMAKRELFTHPLSAWYFSSVGAFSVNRDKLEVSTVKSALAVLKKSNRVLGLFPEGTRKQENVGSAAVSEAKRGVAFFSRAANVPILPIGIARIGPENKTVHVLVGDLIPPPESDDLTATMQVVETALAGLLAEAQTSYDRDHETA